MINLNPDVNISGKVPDKIVPAFSGEIQLSQRPELMDKFVIKGGNRISGSVEIGASKNSFLPILAACLLVEKGEVLLNLTPNLMDIDSMLKVIEHLGVKVKKYSKDRKLAINSENLNNFEAPYDLVRKMRASFLVLGPLLARLGKARVSLPGGCVLGQRPVDQHIKGFRQLGATLEEDQGYIVAQANGLKGNVVYFDRPTHTGTENLITGACLGEGKTTLVNAACDPEVLDVANFLNRMGAKIEGAGTPVITITGVKRLKACEYTPMPDRLEAGTFMMAAAITGGYLEIKNVEWEHLGMVNLKLKEMGVEIEQNKSRIKVKGPKKLKATNVITYPYPGFPTDLQPMLMAMASVAAGTSYIRETVFDSRFTHVMELVRLGADIKVSGDEATVTGVAKLKGASVMASDIRAGVGLVLAGLAAEGETEVLRVYHIDRGYENLEEKLSQVGVSICRQKT